MIRSLQTFAGRGRPHSLPPRHIGAQRAERRQGMRPTRFALVAFMIGGLAGVPVPAQGASARFAVIGDYGLAGAPAAAVAGLVASWAPDFVLTTGDHNYPAISSEWPGRRRHLGS